jgi:hypothetical protein
MGTNFAVRDPQMGVEVFGSGRALFGSDMGGMGDRRRSVEFRTIREVLDARDRERVLAENGLNLFMGRTPDRTSSVVC